MLTYLANCLSIAVKKSAEESLHDNASAYRSHVGQANVFECGFEEMCRPPYSSDQTPNVTICFQI